MPNYIKGIYIKTDKKYKNNLELDIHIDEFFEQIEKLKDTKGVVRLKFVKRKNITETGISHSCVDNTWEKKEKTKADSGIPGDDDSIPF